VKSSEESDRRQQRDLPLNISIDQIRVSGRIPSFLYPRWKHELLAEDAIYRSLIQRRFIASVIGKRSAPGCSQGRENIVHALKGLEEGTSPEFIAFEVRSALEFIGEIVGETVHDDVLNRIFAQFCIGK
jgi:hypothetical protein